MVPGIAKLLAGERKDAAEIGKDKSRACRPQHVCAEWVEGCVDSNRHVAVERSAPEVCGKLKSDQSLLTSRRTGITSDRRDRRGVIKSLVRSIYRVYDDRGACHCFF